MVKTSVLFPEQNFVLEMAPESEGCDLGAWLTSNRKLFEERLVEFGAVVLRGFKLSPAAFRKLTAVFDNGSVPRQLFKEFQYDSVPIDNRASVPHHHEMSYLRMWPMKLIFFCEIPPVGGGEVCLVSTRAFMGQIDPA